MSKNHLALGGIALFIFLLLLSGGLYSLAVPKDAQPEAGAVQTRQGPKKWTFMVYMAADNNLEPEAINDINEMEVIGSTDELNIIVQVDRAEGYAASDPDWTGTRRYYITKDPYAEQPEGKEIRSDLLEDMGELDMSKQPTFKDFVEWGMTDFPAENYALIIWDHGEGLTRAGEEDIFATRAGFCKDNGALQIWNLEYAFRDLRSEGRMDQNIDVIGFDICYGGFFEFAYQLREYVDFYVGSFDEVPEPGWDYRVPLSTLKGYPDISPRLYATNIVDYYADTYQRETNYLTIAAMDINGFMEGLMPSIDELAHQLALGCYYYVNDFQKVRLSTEDVYGLNGFPTKKYADLYHFCELLQDQENVPLIIKEAAKDVMNNYTKAVMAHRHQTTASTYHNNNHGPGIYFPQRSGAKVLPSMYRSYSFSKTVWGDFLTAFLSPVEITYKPVKDTEDPHHSPALKVKVRTDAGISVVNVYIDRQTDPITAKKLDNITYEAVLPPQATGTTVHYYIEVKDVNGVTHIWPPGGKYLPKTYGLSYKVGADSSPPVIQHIPPGKYKAKGGDVSIYARLTDNLGIDDSSAKLFYRKMEVGGSSPFISVPLKPIHPDDLYYTSIFGQGADPDEIYVGVIPQQPLNTILEYYFQVRDSSTAGNLARLPGGAGSFEMTISGSEGPIMFDNYYGSWSSHSKFKLLAEEKGYEVQELTQALQMGDLAKIRVLIITNPSRDITGDELTELKGFVGSGGDLLVIGDSQSRTQANTFLDFAGLEFVTGSSSEQVLSNAAPHPILEGVDTIKLGASTVRVVPGNDTVHDEIIRNNNDALVMANSSYGDGKVLASADKILDDARLDLECNSCLGGNILFWLSQNLDPVADISAPDKVSTNSTFTLSAGASYDPDGNLVNFTWDMGDGTPAKYGRSITHTFTARGIYKVKLIVTDNEEGVGIDTTLIWVNSGPVAEMEILSGELKTNRPIRFRSNSYDPDGHIYSTHWDFGDGNLSFNATPEHVYERAALYTVTLWVMDDMGLNDSVSMDIFVSGDLVNLTVKVSTADGDYFIHLTDEMITYKDEKGNDVDQVINVTEEYNVRFELLEFTSKSEVNYTWTFGDGSVSEHGKVVHHAFLSQGMFAVFLYLKGDDGATGNIWIYINARNVVPSPKIRVLEEDGTVLTFSAGDDIDTPNEVLFYKWRFGDGTTLNTTESVVTHNFSYTGDFTVWVEVYDDEGAFGSDDIKVSINDADYTILFLLLIFGSTFLFLILFIALMGLIIKREDKPSIERWTDVDPNMHLYEIGAVAALVITILVFGIGMVYIINLGGDLGATERLIGRLAAIVLAFVIAVVGGVIIYRRNGERAHTYISRTPFSKNAKKVEKMVRSLKLPYDRADAADTVFHFPQNGLQLKVVRVLDHANQDIGTMFELQGKDYPAIDRIKLAVIKKKL